MQTSEKSVELYDELAKQIDAGDDAGARRVFQELLTTGLARQEIVSQISRLIENRSAGKTTPNGTEEIRWLRPHGSTRASRTQEHKHRFDISAEKPPPSPEIARTDADPAQHAGEASEFSPEPQAAPSGEPERPISKRNTAVDQKIAIESDEARNTPFRNVLPRPVDVSSERSALSVPERLASKLQKSAQAAEAKQAAPAEAVAVADQPGPAQHGSGVSSRRLGTILAGTSAIAAAVAGFFVIWNVYSSDLEELSSANTHRALSWLERVRGTKVSSSPGPAKPTEKKGQSEQSTAGHESDEIPQPPLTAAAVTESAGTQSELNTGATSTRATAEIAEKTPQRMEAPGSPVSSQQNEQHETGVAQGFQSLGSQLPSIDTGTLVAQGDQLLRNSDVASARLLYQRAADAGDGRGALRMGMTFDPVFLARWRLRRVWADRAQAIAWYRRASALGNADAELMQSSLSRRTASASRSIPGAGGQHSQGPGIAAPRSQRTSHGRGRSPALQDAKRG